MWKKYHGKNNLHESTTRKGEHRMKPTMMKTSIREVRGSFGRYLAILAIVALGVGFFSGLKVSKTAMIKTGETYLETHSFYHFRTLSTLGFTTDDVQFLAKQKGIETARGAYFADVMYQNEDGEEGVVKVHSITEGINQLEVIAGRIPETETECVVDANLFGKEAIGQTLKISNNNTEETLDLFENREFKIVGICYSPNYINFERGTTSIGNGKIGGFIYLKEEAFQSDYYMEIYLRTNMDAPMYSSAYDEKEEIKQEVVESFVEERRKLRFETIQQDALDEIEVEERTLKREETDALAKFEDARKELENSEKTLKESEEKLLVAKSELLKQENILKDPQTAYVLGEQGVAEGLLKIKAARAELRKKTKELEAGKDTLEESKKEYHQEYDKFLVEITDAKEKIADAKLEVADLDSGKTYVLGRKTNVGVAYFENDASIVEGIANVFPVFFFLVAALVCITTMNRMVEEQRTQIGVMKALGYHQGSIMGKYMYYSGSAAIMGSIVGYWLGTIVFPKTIWEAYKMMYQMGEVQYVFDWPLAIISGVVACICSFGTTYLSCHHELRIQPATLMRPKAPKNGKRILLERIPFIWTHLKFLHKVSLRNVFRYKRKFMMMVLGISGCSALLVTGFGIKDSIATVADTQFSEIQLFDISLTLGNSPTDSQMNEIHTASKGLLHSYGYFSEMSVDLVRKNQSIPMRLVVPQNMDSMSTFIDLHTKKGEHLVEPKEGYIILNEKYSRKYNLKIGDSIVLKDEDQNQIEVIIQGFNENFIFNYGYISKETYQEAFGKEPMYKIIYGNLEKNVDAYEAATAFMDLPEVTSSSINEVIKDRFRDMMVSLDYIVLLVIFSAGGLAFVVLYNLTNINITERIREIATIKVLGFLPMETVSYVFRENFMLTVIGAGFGLILGNILHRYVMYNINVEAMNFQVQILPASYLYSVLLTFLFALIVNIVMYFKLERIHMAESLKSNE